MIRICNHIALMSLLLLCGCKQEHLSPKEFVRWVRDEANGLVVTKELEPYSFSLQYTPVEYSVLLEQGADHINKQEIATKKKERENMQYYTLRLRSADNREILSDAAGSEQASRLEYFMGPAQDDIVLIEGRDTLMSSLYHFERSYGLDNGNAIVLGFEKTPGFASTDKELIYNDRVLGTGPVHLTISHTAIQQIPPIRYEN